MYTLLVVKNMKKIRKILDQEINISFLMTTQLMILVHFFQLHIYLSSERLDFLRNRT